MACAVSSKSQGGIVDSVIGDVVVLQGTIELLWNDPIDPWLQACRAPGTLMSQLAGACGLRRSLSSERWSNILGTVEEGGGRPSFVSMACAASPWSAPQPSINRLILRGNNYLGSDLYQRRYQHFRRLPNVSPRGR